VVDVGDAIIQVGQSVDENLVILASGGIGYASFASDGTAKLISGANYAGTIRVCSTSTSLSNDNRVRDIVILRTGRVEITRTPGVAASCPSP
jgi:type IV fimbrial biogenesis protein FimT